MVPALLAAMLSAGCASPELQEYPDYQSRVYEGSDGPITVRVSALTPTESLEVYDLPLAARGIQPVWVEVENRDTVPYWFLAHGLDPNYYPHWEAAEAFSVGESELFDFDRRDKFEALSLPDLIPPGEVASGFVLTTLDEGFKFVHTDFLRSNKLRHISLIIPVPGFRADYETRGTFEKEYYSPEEKIDLSDDLAAFRESLQALPCCVSNKKGTKYGDPLNLVIVGEEGDAFAALAERGWRPTETTWSGSVLKMMASTLGGDPYLYSPISPLYLYGRPQDLALQKARDNIHQRNHLRLWLSPYTFRGKPVWVGQISRDIGTRLTIHSPYLTTHKIDPDVDEARTALLEDLAYSQHLQSFGLVSGVGAATRDEPRGNLTTDPYYTDGFRAVLIFDAQSTPMDAIGVLPWETKDIDDAD